MRPTVPVLGSVLPVEASVIGMVNGWLGSVAGTMTSLGGRSAVHAPETHSPLQQSVEYRHELAVPRHWIDDVHFAFAQKRGYWQSSLVKQTPPSSGFCRHMPAMHP